MIKLVVKIEINFRSRSISCVDQFNSWFDLFTWRFQFFKGVMRFYENTDQTMSLPLPIHTLAQSQLQLAKSLRRNNQVETALNELNS